MKERVKLLELKECKGSVIGNVIRERKLDALPLTETKLKGNLKLSNVNPLLYEFFFS